MILALLGASGPLQDYLDSIWIINWILEHYSVA